MATGPYHKWLGIPVEEQPAKRGDKLGMQPPVGGCTTAQKKSRAIRAAKSRNLESSWSTR